MIRNYFKIALRNLLRHKGYAAINVTGLAIGIAACLLLFLVVRYEMSYDKSQPKYEHLYRVVTQNKYPDRINYTSGVPNPVVEALRTKIPGADFAAINSIYGSQISVIDNGTAKKKFIEDQGIFFCEPQFFKLFRYTWTSGTPAALNEPGTVVLTKKFAEKYFGNWVEAMNKTLLLDNSIPMKVSGILENPPTNTDFPIGILISFETLKKNAGTYNYYGNEWGSTSSNFQLYTFLPEGLTAQNVNKQLLDLSTNYTGNGKKSHFLQPLKDLHFDNRFETFGDHITQRSTLWTLSLIGLFIIIMACINFINLSTAQAIGRSKEIGVRKVLGSSRTQLFSQVMGETALIVAIAGVLAALIAFLCLPFIKHIASIEEKLSLFNLQTMAFSIAIGVAVTLFAGLYPALVLSGFKPVMALKNRITSAKVGGISLRRGLVVLQFAISQVLIIGTVVAVMQMNFVHNADLGFNKEAVLVISTNSDSSVTQGYAAFKQKLLQFPGVSSVSFNSDEPSSDNNWSNNFAFDHKEDEPFPVYLKYGDEDYFKTFGLIFIAGKGFSKSDTALEMVINETLLKKLQLKKPEDALGKDIRIGSQRWKKIVGVVKDFKTNSLREAINPILIAENHNFYAKTAIKINTSNIVKTRADVENAWNSFYPSYAYKSSFVEEKINDFYRQENQLSLLYKIFAGLAIFISSLGLFGLVSFMAVQKTKEVGIRKVLGASERNIVYLFSKEFTVLILLSFVIAAPVAYYMMTNWLQDFVYRIKLGAGVFIIAIVISIFIAWITVGYKAVKAAMANPVKSLRTE